MITIPEPDRLVLALEVPLKFVYHCSECSKEYGLTPQTMLCKICAQKQRPNYPLRGILDVAVHGKLDDNWTPRDLMPVPAEFFPAIPVGDTPLWKPERLRRFLDQPNLFIKDETSNPTGSLKDRASLLVAAFARRFQLPEICLASTGNAGSSMAGVGAAANLMITLFLPAAAPQPKQLQARQYGARIYLVNGNYDQACALCLQYAEAREVLCRNTGYNPLTIDGKKSVALEIFQQMGVPDHVFVPCGDGVILCGVYKGFRDLMNLGVTSRMPTIHGVFAAGSDAIPRFMENDRFEPQPAHTVADSISVEVPAAGLRAATYLKRFGGQTITVPDEAILKSQLLLSGKSGLFVEPAAAAALAGFLAVKKHLSKKARSVILATGNGLKDPVSAGKILSQPAPSITRLDQLGEA